MAKYDLSRLSLLIVEDSQFMRGLLVSVLKALGIERITVAENGEEAIAIMSPAAKTQSSMVGATGVDVILCDFFMPVVDGSMFLRWVRLAEKSPDRFLPFIMVSAAADRDIIVKSRDAGVNEFVAKPFSAEAVMQRIISVVERPRQFIYCPTYFGPDRRRRKVNVPDDKRKMKESDIEVIHSGKDMGALRKSSKKVWYFRLPKSLRSKLSTGASDPNDPPFDPDLLKAAESKVNDMESDYADWVGDSIEKLVQAHHRAIEDMENAEGHLEEIHNVAHELRGQGGIFGYPLMTQFGKSLYETTGEGTVVNAQVLDLINAHIDLIKVVMSQKVKGDGGALGKELMQSLHEAKKKHAKQEDSS